MLTDDGVLMLVAQELLSAREKFSDFRNGHEGKAVIEEELDELWHEVKHGTIQRARREAVQVAAMAVRFIVDLADQIDHAERSEGGGECANESCSNARHPRSPYCETCILLHRGKVKDEVRSEGGRGT